MAELAAALIVVFGVMVFVTLMMVPIAIARGYCLSVLWRWFAVPIFHLPTLTIAQAIGIGMVVGMFQTSTSSGKHSGKEVTSIIFGNVFAWLIVLGMGWILKTYFI